MRRDAPWLLLRTKQRRLVQGVCSPCAGHYYNRIWVITAGCVLWGVMTAGFATTHSVAQASDTFPCS